MTLCEESCYVITDRCQSQFTSIEGSKFDGFFYPLYNFNCSSPESYLIPGFPPDMENCLQADDVGEFIVNLECMYDCCASLLTCINLHMQLTFRMTLLHFPVSYLYSIVDIHTPSHTSHTHIHTVVTPTPTTPANVVTLIFSVTTSLCLVIVMCLTILVILFVCNKSKMKKYYQKWKLSTNQR